jgi:hypothetical protein
MQSKIHGPSQTSHQLPANILPLTTHELFESLYSPPTDQIAPQYPILINFSADWCGPCKKLDWNFIVEEFPDITIYRCDVDVNKYTPGFCGIKKIPSCLFLTGPKQVTPLFQPSGTADLASWISMTLQKTK